MPRGIPTQGLLIYKNKEWLEQRYIHEGLSIRKIANLCGKTVSQSTIFHWLKEFEIPRRGRGLKGNNNPHWKPKITVKCEICGKILERPPSLVNKHNFCSNAHLIEWLARKNKNGEEIECRYCGKKIYRRRHELKNINFCSYSCQAKYKWMDPNFRQLISEQSKRNWKDPSYKKKFMENYLKALSKWRWIRPTMLEKSLIELIKKYNLPYKYVGDGTTFIGGKVPDFMNHNGEKKLIELVGDFWHIPEEIQEKVEHYAKYGYKTLVIWEHDVNSLPEKEIAERIRSF